MLENARRSQAARAADAASLPPVTAKAATKIDDWSDFANLTEDELTAIFRELGWAPTGAGRVSGSELKAMALRSATGQERQMLMAQPSSTWNKLAGAINQAVGGAGMGDPNRAMARLFKQEYAKTCMCGPQAFADALGSAETRFAANAQKALMGALAGQNMPGMVAPAAPLIVYSVNDPEIGIAQAMIGGGQQVAQNQPPGGNNNPPPGGGNNPPPAGGNNPPPAGGNNPPPAGGNNPPPGGGNNPPPAGGNNPPPGGGNNPPPAGGNNPVPVQPPGPPNPPDGGGGPAADLLNLELPPPPGDLGDPGLPPVDNPLSNTDSVDPTELDKVVSFRGDPAPPPPPCSTPECFQAALDQLAQDRKILGIEKRFEPIIQALDTIGDIGLGVGGAGCVTGNPVCAVIVLGGTAKGLKVLLTGGRDASINRERGGDKFSNAGVFFSTVGVEGSVEVGKEIVGAGVGKITKVVGGAVGGEITEFSVNTVETVVGMGLDNAGTLTDATVKISNGKGGEVVTDTKTFMGDVGRVMTGGGF